MKIALVYTTTTPQLIETVEQEVLKQLPGAALASYQDPSILTETRQAGYVTKYAAARLVGLFAQAVTEGADGILNVCSSVGLVAEKAQGAFVGTPLVRIDEAMLEAAALGGSRVGILATLPSTLEPTRATLLRVAADLDRRVQPVDGCVDAFGADPGQFRQLLLERALSLKPEIDLLVLAQGAMAYCENFLRERLGLPVLSSPRFGAAALGRALGKKGLTLC
jgi:Asp/Glu/hydantoin racemase